MAERDNKTVIVERDQNASGPFVAIIVLVVFILLAIFALPYLTGGSGSAPTENVTPTTGQ